MPTFLEKKLAELYDIHGNFRLLAHGCLIGHKAKTNGQLVDLLVDNAFKDWLIQFAKDHEAHILEELCNKLSKAKTGDELFAQIRNELNKLPAKETI